MTQTKGLTKIWQIKVDLNKKGRQLEIVQSRKTKEITQTHALMNIWQVKFHLYQKGNQL